MSEKVSIEDALRELARIGYIDTHEHDDLRLELEELRDVARGVAEADPIYSTGWSDTRYCFFCDRDQDFREGHDDDCLWIRARALGEA